MKSFKDIIIKIKQYGLIPFLQKGFQHILGIHKLYIHIHKQKEEIDTLYYFFNEYFPPQSFPPTRDYDARIMQLCDAALLAIFDKICKKYGLHYWLSSGTLLGAVRHKGFIPWDDDMDVSMIRKDFDWLRDNIPEEFRKYGIDVNYSDARIGISYLHHKTGIWLDVFAADEVCTDGDFKDEYGKIKQYQKISLGKIDNKSTFEQAAIRNKYLSGKGKNKYIIDALEFGNTHAYEFLSEYIFPLTTLEFEGYQLMVPHNYDAVLCRYYGISYMCLPHSGINHHGIGRTPLKTWAKAHNVDMDEVKSLLENIYNNI